MGASWFLAVIRALGHNIVWKLLAREGGSTRYHAWPQSYDQKALASLQRRDGARRVFTGQADIACTYNSAKRREVSGESHEGGAASY